MENAFTLTNIFTGAVICAGVHFGFIFWGIEAGIEKMALSAQAALAAPAV
jgi:hypothetical protein